jgi:hypothetical protein
MTDKEALEEIRKFGDYGQYKATLLNEQPQQPLSEKKLKGDAAQVFFAHSDALAKRLGLSVQELFQRDPARYAQYKELL